MKDVVHGDGTPELFHSSRSEEIYSAPVVLDVSSSSHTNGEPSESCLSRCQSNEAISSLFGHCQRRIPQCSNGHNGSCGKNLPEAKVFASVN